MRVLSADPSQKHSFESVQSKIIWLFWLYPQQSDKKRQRRMRLAGHSAWHQELTAIELIIWEPSHGHRTRGRPHATFLDTLKKATWLRSASEIRTLMEDRDEWRVAIRFPSWRQLTSWHRIAISHLNRAVQDSTASYKMPQTELVQDFKFIKNRFSHVRCCTYPILHQMWHQICGLDVVRNVIRLAVQ